MFLLCKTKMLVFVAQWGKGHVDLEMKQIISLCAHNQLDNWAIYLLKLGCSSKTASCFLWSVGISPIWIQGSCHLSSYYKNSDGNLSENTRQIVIKKEEHIQQRIRSWWLWNHASLTRLKRLPELVVLFIQNPFSKMQFAELGWERMDSVCRKVREEGNNQEQ